MRVSLACLRALAGVAKDSSGHLEKWVAAARGLVGLLGVLLISEAQLGLTSAAGPVASMGASAMLLFAVPHGPLSQPWPVFGGHLVSAFIGVACGKMIPEPTLAAAARRCISLGSRSC